MGLQNLLFIKRSRLASIFLILLIPFILFTYKLGQPSLFEEDEAKITEVAREIIVTGKWINPQHNFVPWFHKPPLYPWLTASSFLIFGESEFMARIWSVIFGLGIIFIVFLIAKLVYDEFVAFIASLMMGTSFLLIGMSRLGSVDTALCFFIALTIYLFLVAENTNKKWPLILTGISTALGVLTKGPLGFFLPAGILFFYLIIEKRFIRFLASHILELLITFLLFLGIATPWWIAETMIYGIAFLKALIGQFMFGIYFTTFQEHNRPFYFYTLVILLGILPWGLFSFYAFIKSFFDKKSPKSILLLIWIILTFILFSFAKTKVAGYILPVFPPLIILTAKQIILLFSQPKLSKKVYWLMGGNSFLWLIFFITFFLIKVPVVFMPYIIIFKILFGIIFGISLIPVLLFFISSSKIQSYKLAIYLILSMFIPIIIVQVATNTILPIVENYKPSKLICAEVKTYLNQNKINKYNLFFYDTFYCSSLIYYMKQGMTQIINDHELNNILKKKNSIVFISKSKLSELNNQNYKQITTKWDLVAIIGRKIEIDGGSEGTRTLDLLRDRQAF